MEQPVEAGVGLGVYGEREAPYGVYGGGGEGPVPGGHVGVELAQHESRTRLRCEVRQDLQLHQLYVGRVRVANEERLQERLEQGLYPFH